MTPITPELKRHPREEDESGIHINSLIMKHKGRNYHLYGGTHDTTHVFTQGVGLYVLNINKATGYIGMNSYMALEPDPINSIYLHNHQEIKETLGAKWHSLNPVTIAKMLITCLY